MFLPVSFSSYLHLAFFIFLMFLPCLELPSVSGSILHFLLPVGFLLRFRCLLLLAMVVVVAMVDLEEGRFSF